MKKTKPAVNNLIELRRQPWSIAVLFLKAYLHAKYLIYSKIGYISLYYLKVMYQVKSEIKPKNVTQFHHNILGIHNHIHKHTYHIKFMFSAHAILRKVPRIFGLGGFKVFKHFL